jgi:hypothetical protein
MVRYLAPHCIFSVIAMVWEYEYNEFLPVCIACRNYIAPNVLLGEIGAEEEQRKYSMALRSSWGAGSGNNFAFSSSSDPHSNTNSTSLFSSMCLPVVSGSMLPHLKQISPAATAKATATATYADSGCPSPATSSVADKSANRAAFFGTTKDAASVSNVRQLVKSLQF